MPPRGFKVRPSRRALDIPCAAELTTMLSCFGSTGDMRAQVVGIGGCADAAKALHTCMNKPKKGGNGRVASINFVLGKAK